MNILIFINSVIPATKYGGTQRVMWSLGKELVKMGHDVTFMAKEGSSCEFARIVTYNPELEFDTQVPEGTDIIHFNNRAEPTAKPYIVTYHGNHMKDKLDMNAVFVSRNHADRYNSGSYVHNGLDWDEYGPVDLNASRSYFHFLGKAAWKVKNVKGAINVIKALPGEKLYVLGGVRFNFKMGWRFTFTPKARFMGMVGGEEKNTYLQHSKGLIFPVVWDEPFGLALTETMYFGAPVFGTPYGSLPEIVKPEVGFLTNRLDEMVDRIKNGPGYDPRTCHEYARDLFNSKVMAMAYLDKYEQVLNGKKLNAEAPHARTAETRKEWIE